MSPVGGGPIGGGPLGGGGGGPLVPVVEAPATDADVLTEIQLLLIEDASWTNGLWTQAEVLGYLNQRQYRFLKETGIAVAWRTLGRTGGTTEDDLPVDWIATIYVGWEDLTAGTITKLEPADRWQTDHLQDPADVATEGTPEAYLDGDTPSLTLGLSPTPADTGMIHLLYVSLSEVCDGSGIIFTVPDEFVPYLKYGVLADMLGKDGRGQDLQRARYCEGRYQEGVALAGALLDGF